MSALSTVRILAAAAVAATLQAAVTVDKVNYKGWPNCFRVSNGEVELIVTGDVGPRIIRFGFFGGQNLFKEFAGQLGRSKEKEFQLRGGHRVWKAPEDPVATWAPDNVAVDVTVTPGGVVAREPVEPLTGLQKEIGVEMAASGTRVTITHRIHNKGLFPLDFAAWALTMMAQGGIAITGFPPRGSHPQVLEATNPLVMWAYTNLSDPRWTFTRKYLLLRQDANNPEPQKLGLHNPDTWAGYWLNGEMFLKRFRPGPAAAHPDFGCSFETFTNADFLEIETLGPMTKVAPGGSVTHIETWSLHKTPWASSVTDTDLDRLVIPLLKRFGE